LEHIILHNPELLMATKEISRTFRSIDNYEYLVKNTNDIATQIPGLMISKTGYTSMAGGNLTVVFDPELGRPIIVTVLGSTRDDRFTDVMALVDATMEHIKDGQK
jgi:D-alanyl-D-alanine carboxypeptidase